MAFSWQISIQMAINNTNIKVEEPLLLVSPNPFSEFVEISYKTSIVI